MESRLAIPRRPRPVSDLPAICQCDHPTLDPTPRAWAEHQYSPVKRVANVSTSLRTAQQGARVHSTGRRALAAAASSASAERVSMSAAIEELGTADGAPTRMHGIDFNEILPSATMGSFKERGGFLASRVATVACQAERHRGAVGFKARDLELRHREHMRRRAALAASATGEARDAEASLEDAAAAAAAQRAEELRLRRLTEPPPVRFWWLMGLCLVGGVLGVHRVALRAWRIVALQCTCVVLGAALVTVSATYLNPSHVSAARYAFEQAFLVGALGYAFAALSLGLCAELALDPTTPLGCLSAPCHIPIPNSLACH